MSLKFCPKCKKILIPEKIKGNEFVEKCGFCSYEKEFVDNPVIIREKIPSREKTGKKILHEGNEFATYNHKCKRGGYGKAQIIDMGVFYSDEDNLILLKCGRCGWSEIIGRKVS